MGRSALILVMGLGFVFAIIGNSIRGTNNYLVGAESAYTKYSVARDEADLGVHRQLRYIDRGVTPPANPISYNGAQYSITTSISLDTLWITSVGQCAESSYTVKAKLLHSPKPFPTVKAAIGSSAHPTTISYTGQAAVDGRNYDATGTTLVGSGNLPALDLWTKQDSINADANVSHLTGAGNPPIQVDTTQENPNNYMDEYKASASYSFTSDVSGNKTFGSSAGPVIVDCDAGDDTTISINFTGNVTGYGILAIRGNVAFKGTFNWFGLVVCYGNNNVVSLQENGASSITGGIMVGGTAGASLSLKGTGPSNKIKYSSAALQAARNIAPLLYYQVVEWLE
jgi:hypothetical protein